MMFYTYILQSEKDATYYVGYTTELKERLEKHNKAKKGYTATKQPWKIVYFEVFETKTEAIKREKAIKNKKSKSYIEYLISNWSDHFEG